MGVGIYYFTTGLDSKRSKDVILELCFFPNVRNTTNM